MKPTKSGRRFATTPQSEVPEGRRGKHRKIVTAIIANLDDLQPGVALKISLLELGDSKENIRSALNRVTRKHKLKVATATDEENLYVWNVND
jgi:hypothetical protein